MVPHWIWNIEVQIYLVVTVCGALGVAASIGSFAAVTKSMYLCVDSIGGDKFPVYLEL